MDGQRFDRLAKAFANSASRRGVVRGFVGGALAAAAARAQTPSARAQCTWSGTFESPLSGIVMTLEEAGGQVSGSYTFTENNAVISGTISGVVRSDFPGYTVLDGYWREPGEGGRLWFAMPLDACSQFTGSYTGADTAPTWTAGWDGVRTTGAGGGNVEITVFTNPADSALAKITQDGQSFTVLGTRDADGLVERVNHVVADAPDGDPEKQVFLDFADDGKLIRGAMASGETMLFEWVSDTRVVVTSINADGSQQVQVPVDAVEAAGGTTAVAGQSETQAWDASESGRLAYSGQPDLMRTLARASVALQNPPSSREGAIKVQCANGAPARDAYVQGSYWKTGTPKTGPGSEYAFQPLYFSKVSPGVFNYRLPLAPAPATPPSGKVATVLWTAVEALCIASTSGEIGLMSEAYICAKITKLAVFATVSCSVIMYAYNKICNAASVSWPGSSIKSYIDNYDAGYEVYAYAPPYVDFERRITVTVTPAEIPAGVINVGGEGRITYLDTTPGDPGPNEGYTISVSTDCAPIGATLTVSVVGTDKYTCCNPPHTVTISDAVTSTELAIPGGGQSIQDQITATLTVPGGGQLVATKTLTF